MTAPMLRRHDIKLLGPGDAGLMNDLLCVFGLAFEDVRTYQDAVPTDAYFTALLSGSQFIALVAMHDDEVVGGIAAYVLPKFERERKEIYIYDLAVAAAHRRQGVATALLQELLSVAADRGAYVIFVQADRDDAPAIALYEKFGIREAVLHFDIGVAQSRI